MLKKQWSESVSLLNGYIDLYQIHSATKESGILENNDVLEELARLRRQGIRIGLSLTGPGQGEVLRKAMEIVFDGSRLFECVQATWNLLEQSAGPALAEAHAAGIGIIVKEVLANGRFKDEADSLRLYRWIATMDKDAPVPALNDQAPTWARASALARDWELNRLADRLDTLAS